MNLFREGAAYRNADIFFTTVTTDMPVTIDPGEVQEKICQPPRIISTAGLLLPLNRFGQ